MMVTFVVVLMITAVAITFYYAVTSEVRSNRKEIRFLRKDHIKKINNKMEETKAAGTFKGKHYTECVDTVKQLKREGRHCEAIVLLLKAVDATEAESKQDGCGVAPWYYEQLAILYRKEKQYKYEVEILERYARQPKAPGIGPYKLAERLVKARELSEKYTT